MTIHQLFEQITRQTPQRICLKTEQQSLTFEQLNRRANQLARQLQSLGVSHESLVGIHLDRCVDMVIAIFAVLKAGAAYVPLDKEYPSERLNMMIADSRLQHVISDSSDANLSSTSATSAPLIEISMSSAATQTQITAWSDENLTDVTVKPEQLAYLIYTSGSTGRPKGVMVEHRNTVALIAWAAGYFSQQERQCVLAGTSLNFDLSVFELFVPLCTGGQVWLVDNALAMLNQQIDFSALTLINTVPSVLQTLLDVRPDFAQHLTINVAGEPLPQALVNQAFANWSVRRVINLYGPSETTTYSSVFSMAAAVDQAPAIGNEIGGTALLVLDEQQQAVSRTEVGELYIAGCGVSRGYLFQPELTEARFLPVPAHLATAANDALMMYRTGDLVKYRADGQLHYIGRIDDQVKINGFRIELGEIQYQLEKFSQVKQAIVTVVTDEAKQKRLVGYCQLHQPLDLAASDELFGQLIAALSQTLPHFMLPDILVQVRQWTLNANGKIDKKQLPAPQWQTNTPALITAENQLEHDLVAIWAKILAIPTANISVTDNFYQLGGHSLLLVRLIYAIEGQFALLLSQQDLAQTDGALTVRVLAGLIEAGLASGESTPWQLSASPVVEVGVGVEAQAGAVPASIQQENFWLLENLQPRQRPVFGVPFYLHFQGQVDCQRLQQALNDVVAQHDVLRTRYELQQSKLMAVVVDDLTTTINWRDVAADSAVDSDKALIETAKSWLKSDESEPFDLTAGRVCLAYYFAPEPLTPEPLTAKSGVLAINVHHIAFDGWSKGVFISQLLERYETTQQAAKPATESSSSARPMQYAAYTRLQHQQWQASAWSSVLQQIGQLLQRRPEGQEFPADRPRAKHKTFRGGVVTQSANMPTAEALQRFAQSQNVSVFTVMHSALNLLIARVSGLAHFIIGAPTANRPAQQYDQMIGCFTNTALLEGKIPKQQSYVDYLQQVASADLQAFAHQQVPLSGSIPELKVSVPMSSLHSPFFNVLLAPEIHESGQYQVDGYAVELLHCGDDIAQLDVACHYHHSDTGLTCRWVFDADMYEPQTMQQYLSEYLLLIEKLLADPTGCVSVLTGFDQRGELSVLQGETLAETLAETLNGACEQPLHHYFAAAARRTPNKTAVQVGAQRYNFAAVEQAANQLAQQLLPSLQQQQTPGAVIGIYATPQIETVVAILAIWKIGAAYLPIDPQFPAARVGYMFDSAQATVCVVASSIDTAAMAHSIPDKITTLTVDWQALTALPASAAVSLDQAADATALAYVMFTSGSTGLPKGVMIEHRSVVNLMHNISQLALQDDNASWGVCASLVFDASVQGLSQLCAGHTVYLLDQDERLSPQRLAAQIKAANIQVMDCTPVLLSQLYEQSPTLTLPNLMVGGEAISPALWQNIAARSAASGCVAYNVYGPTECTVNSTIAPIEGMVVHLGMPLANVQLQLLNQQGEICPVGDSGEICLFGFGLARGYLGDSDLKNSHDDSFTTRQVDADHQVPCYRSGDYGYIDAAGRLIFAGRKGSYVKHLGYRLSLQEIESRIKALSTVMNAVVMLVEQPAQLVAFIQWQPHTIAKIDSIKPQLAGFLPPYMIPSCWVEVQNWPLNVSGKVDRQALLPLIPTRQSQAETPLEHQVAEMISDLLSQPSSQPAAAINFAMGFVQLGGSSVLAAKFAIELRQTFAVTLSLVDVLLADSLHQLCQLIVERQQSTPADEAFSIGVVPTNSVFEEDI